MSASCELRSLTVGWALHALEPEDEQRVLDHLPHCRACRAALAGALDVTAALAAAVPAVDPPPALRERVLAEARANTSGGDRPRPSSPPPALHPVALARHEPPETAPAPIRSAPSGPSEPRRRPARRWAVLVGAAVVAGIVMFSARAVLPTATPEGTDQGSVAQRAQRLVDDSEGRDPAGSNAMLRDATGDPVAVVLDDGSGPRFVPLAMPPTGEDREYVLWRLAGVGARAVAVYDATSGTTRPVTTAGTSGTPEAAPVQGFAVSVEPAGPVPERPSVVVARGAVV